MEGGGGGLQNLQGGYERASFGGKSEIRIYWPQKTHETSFVGI